MKHIRKFNEDIESNELGFKLIGGNLAQGVPKGDIEIDSDIFIGRIYSPERKLATLPDGSQLKYGYDQGDGRIQTEFVLIVKDGKIEVAIYEYEISNPFIFGDIVVVPGHDAITCYNFKTGESTTEYIR
jgi:hypothetical protein